MFVTGGSTTAYTHHYTHTHYTTLHAHTLHTHTHPQKAKSLAAIKTVTPTQ